MQAAGEPEHLLALHFASESTPHYQDDRQPRQSRLQHAPFRVAPGAERAWLRPDSRNTRLRERQKRLNACEIRAKTP
jgi:hypothetical protein